MREGQFLESRITRLWRLHKVQTAPGLHSYKAKVDLATAKLAKFAAEKNVPLSFLLSDYAYTYTFAKQETSFHKIYLRVGEFMDSYDPMKVDLSEDDVIFAYQIESEWNEMQRVQSKDFPFSLRTAIAKAGVRVGTNTFFVHSNRFRDFCQIAVFVRQNRKNFPQVSGLKEFFLHLPVIRRKSGEYTTWQYVSPTKTLEEYYQMMYGNRISRGERFKRFSDLLKDSETSGLQDVWGFQEMRLHPERCGEKQPKGVVPE
jgi:hypothetical protein